MLLLTTSRTSTVASAAHGGSPKTPTSVTQSVIAAIYHGLQMTLSPTTRTKLPAVACLNNEHHKATPTVKTSVLTIPLAIAMVAQTADGVGLLTPATSGYQLKACADASPMTSFTTLVIIAEATTTASVVPTAPAVTGPGLQTILSGGNQTMLTADARLRISGRLTLAAIATS